jgi:hypothetical protein
VSFGFLASASSIFFMSAGQWKARAAVENSAAAAATAMRNFIVVS